MNKIVAICPVYNQSEYLRQWFENISFQTIPLTIVWSDDNSTDDSYEKIQALTAAYHGRHTMITRQNARNLGHGRNVFAVMDEFPADFYIEFDDDVSSFNRAEILIGELKANPEIQLIGSNFEYASPSGVGNGNFEYFPKSIFSVDALIAGSCILNVAGHTFAWRRSLCESFRNPELRLGSGDFILALRAALLGGYCYTDQCLVRYRLAPKSLSRPLGGHGDSFSDARLYYLMRVRGFEGLGQQMNRDIDWACDCGFIRNEEAIRLKNIVARHFEDSLKLYSAAASETRLNLFFQSMISLRNKHLRSVGIRLLSLALAPKFFYSLKKMRRNFRGIRKTEIDGA